METQHIPVAIFYSCSDSPTDTPLLEQLESHLSTLQREGLIAPWHKRRIAAGSVRQEEIDHHLNTAALILLLVSNDFLASDYCYGTEMQRALQRHAANEAHVIPILLRSCVWQNAPFADLEMLPTGAKPITMWRDRDAAWTDVVMRIRQALDRKLGTTMQLADLQPGRIWNIPIARNPFFTGRDALLEQLHTHLQTTQATAISQPRAISGLGGIGKTQLAIEYVYRYLGEYQAILWARADTTEALNAAYTEIAGLLALPQKEAQEQEIIVQAVKHWLRETPDWLLILDNADDLNLVQPFLPSMCPGHLLLTTCAQTMGKVAQRFEIETLDAQDGAMLLLLRAGVIPAGAPFDAASASDQAQALTLTKELGGLPLALDQAGAYIEETQCGLADYHQQYQTRRAELLARRGALVDDHPESVTTTLLLSFTKVEAANPTAAEVLRICAFLAPNEIPEELLMEALNTPLFTSEEAEADQEKREKFLGLIFALGDQSRQALLATKEKEFHEAVAILRTYSLLQRNSAKKTLSVHRLVQEVVCDSMSVEAQQQWIRRVIHAVVTIYPKPDFANWPIYDRLLPHSIACANWIEQRHLNTPEAFILLTATGLYLNQRGRYRETERVYKQALTVAEKELGEWHWLTATSLNNLAELYRLQGKYAEAELLHERAFVIRMQELGATHPDTTLSLNNLGSLYQGQGNFAKAEQMHKWALEIQEQELGEEHLQTAHSLNNLAMLYLNQGKYTEAEPLFKKALAMRAKMLGETHPQTQISLNNLAGLYLEQRKYAEAEPLFERGLAIHIQELGEVHPDTAASLNNLATVYKKQKQYGKAELFYKRALETVEQVLGEDHPYTVSSLNNLALLYKEQRNYIEAELLYKQVLAIVERYLGTTHPLFILGLNNLAALYHDQRKYVQGEPLYKQALSIAEQMLGSEHPYTQTIQANYATLLEAMK